MQTDMYTKFVLTLIAIGLFAVAFMNTGLFDIPDAHAQVKKGQWSCWSGFADGIGGETINLGKEVAELQETLNSSKAKHVFKTDWCNSNSNRCIDIVCYRK